MRVVERLVITAVVMLELTCIVGNKINARMSGKGDHNVPSKSFCIFPFFLKKKRKRKVNRELLLNEDVAA
jgi:hypothetical protein